MKKIIDCFIPKIQTLINIRNLPKIGKQYHFFDDGKTGPSRIYIAKILDIIPLKEVKDKKLLKAYRQQKKENYWIYAKRTDYFIKCECKKYDDDPLYFIRTIDGGWFSIDYPHEWMSGRLDVDNKIWNRVKEENKNEFI